MPLNAAQIVNLSCQIAKCPGFVSQAGNFLNSILSDLCQTYNIETTRSIVHFNFNSATGMNSGPYALPSDWLRAKNKDVFYTLFGVVYPMIKIELDQYDWLVQQAGLASYPSYFTTDTSAVPPQMFVWVPPAGSYPVTARYYRQMPDIVAPETSTDVPWFKNQDYLVTKLAGKLMLITNDDRAGSYLGDIAGNKDSPPGAEWLLRRYLTMQGDRNDIPHRVELDRRRFGQLISQLPHTKTIGW